jgi:hypothetical protein
VRGNTVAAKDVRTTSTISFTHPFTTMIRRKATGSGGHSLDYAGISVSGGLPRTLTFYSTLTNQVGGNVPFEVQSLRYSIALNDEIRIEGGKRGRQEYIPTLVLIKLVTYVLGEFIELVFDSALSVSTMRPL